MGPRNVRSWAGWRRLWTVYLYLVCYAVFTALPMAYDRAASARPVRVNVRPSVPIGEVNARTAVEVDLPVLAHCRSGQHSAAHSGRTVTFAQQQHSQMRFKPPCLYFH